MRRLSTPELVLSLGGALCAVGFVALWLARDARAVDATSALLGVVEAAGVDERAAAAQGERVALESRSEPPIAERRALAASDARTLLELHPERSQLDFVVSAAGAPVADAIIVLFASSDLAPPIVVAAPGLSLTEGGGVVTDLRGRASVAVAPKVEWCGIVRWTPHATAAPLSAEFRAVSPIAGYPRVIAIDLGSIQASRFLHIEVCSAPSGLKLGGAELFTILDDGSPAPAELGPTRVVSGADGRALLWWPIGTRLCVEAGGHTPLELHSAHLDRVRGGVVHTTLEAAAAAAPTPLELSMLGALHGRLDPRWAAGGRVFVSGPTGGSLGGRQLRGGVAHSSYDRERTATVTATGHWRIDGLPTHIPPDPSRAFATVARGGLVVRFEGADVNDAPRVVRATVGVDVWLGAGEDLEVPDPFGACASVALTARGREDLDLDGARVELHLIRLPGEDAGVADARHARRLLSRQLRITAADELVADGRATATGRVLAPDLPLGLYELRVPHLVTVEERFNDIQSEPIIQDPSVAELDVSERFFRAWGRFEHDGRPVEVQLTSGQPEDDGRPVEVQLNRRQPPQDDD